MIQLKSVRKSFGGTPVLDDISFTVASGEKVSLLGPGGCGKTTILKLILGLERPDAGEITLLEEDMVAASESAKRELLKRVGMAFQQGALFDYMTVADNLI